MPGRLPMKSRNTALKAKNTLLGHILTNRSDLRLDFYSMRKIIFITIATLGIFLFVFAGFSHAGALSEDMTGRIGERIREANVSMEKGSIDGPSCVPVLMRKFYGERKFKPAWSDDAGPLPQAKDFLEVIREASREGLRPEDYHLSKMDLTLAGLHESMRSGRTPDIAKLVELDLLLSDAFFLYASHLLYGRTDHRNLYPEWVVYQRSGDLAAMLNNALSSRKIEESLAALIPFHPGYAGLKEKLTVYRRIAENGGWPQIPRGAKMERGSHDRRVALLRQRLSVSGDLEIAKENTGNAFDQRLKEAVQRFQKRHGLKMDGAVGPSTIDAMNIPVGKRIRQIALNMDRLRWLPDRLGDRYVFVNIADFHMKVVEDDREVMSMKIIVGKRDWRSCVLSAKMTYLELNPYWKVPDSIATKELLPEIKKNPEYLAKKNIKMFRNWNDQGESIDPGTVDWSRIRTKDFPYKFRQEPGLRNPLGRIKFIFPNACEIYLHDTSSRHLFGRQRRDFSHGCIRIEKPIDLAVYLLKDKETWTQKKILAEIRKGKRQVIILSKPFDVHIFYGTAWVDSDGNLQFRDDIYQIDEAPYPLTFHPAGAVQAAAS